MVTQEELGQVISEFESLRDMMIEEISKLSHNLELLREEVNEMKAELKIGSKRIS